MENKEILERAEEIQNRIDKKKDRMNQIMTTFTLLDQAAQTNTYPSAQTLSTAKSFEEYEKEYKAANSKMWEKNLIGRKLAPEYFRLKEEIEKIKKDDFERSFF